MQGGWQYKRPTVFSRLTCCLFLAIVGVQFSVAGAAADIVSTPTEAYAIRGKQIELLYENYTSILRRQFDRLRKVVAGEAPGLLVQLDKDPPKRRARGYKFLPKILPEIEAVCAQTRDLPAAKRYRPRSSRYSWDITRRYIDRQLELIEQRLASKLNGLLQLSRAERRDVLELTVGDYSNLRAKHRTIDKLIQHNWLWQKDVSVRKHRFERGTLLHDVIVEHAALQDALEAQSDADFRAALSNTRYADSQKTRVDLEGQLRMPMTALARQIDAAARGLEPRDYVDVEQRDNNTWIVKVPVFTDIEDTDYLRQLARAVETRWCLDDGSDKFRLKITYQYISTQELYGVDTSRSECDDEEPMPVDGDKIDLLAHCRKFPSDGARLSSGASKTYIRAGCMFLGPEDVKPALLAHEFGHLLGFADEYVRGYRDLGESGYEILEILPNNHDLMASSGSGGVHRYHFDALVKGVPYRRLFRQGYRSMTAEKYIEAVDLYRQAIAASFDDAMAADAYNNLGWSLTKLQRYREAVTAYENALKARKDYQRARNNLRAVRALLESPG